MNFDDHTIPTNRLVLRTCRMSDAAALSVLMTPDISRWVAAWPSPLSIETATGILGDCLATATEGRVFPAVIIEKQSDQIIGWLKIDIPNDGERVAELGYWIGEASQGKGYAFEVATAAVQLAFNTLSADAVIAGAQIDNRASHKLLMKTGMRTTQIREIWAPARARYEACQFWRLDRVGR